MSILEAIPQAWAAGFLVGQGWVTSLSEVERWSGVDFTQLIGGRGGSLEENGGVVTGRRWNGSPAGR